GDLDAEIAPPRPISLIGFGEPATSAKPSKFTQLKHLASLELFRRRREPRTGTAQFALFLRPHDRYNYHIPSVEHPSSIPHSRVRRCGLGNLVASAKA